MRSLTQNISFLILIFLGILDFSFVCDCRSPPTPSSAPHNQPKPLTKPTASKPPPSTPKPPMKPPTIKPPPFSFKPPTHKPPPVVSCPQPTTTPTGGTCPQPTPTPAPHYVTPPTPIPPDVPTTPPIIIPTKPIPPEPETCPINSLKLNTCVDILGGCIHIGIGNSHAKEACCPVLGGLFGMDAAICLCTTIEAKVFNMDLIIPIAIQILLDCGRPPPPGFKCPT